MDTVQGIFSLVISMGQAPKQLQKELHQLKELKLPAARLLIDRSEWVMFKDKNLEALVLQLKYATYDAEDLLRGLEDQALRQRIEDADRGWAGQTLSSYQNNLKHFVLRTSQSIRDAEEKLDNVIGVVEKMLCSMGLDDFQPMQQQFMPTTTEIITASQVYGRDTERDQLMEMLGVTATIDREDEINQVVTQLITQSGSKGKSAAGQCVDASTPKSAKRHKGDTSSSSSSGNVSVLPIFGIGGMGKTTLAQLIYNDERVTAHFTLRIWVCVSDLFDIERMTKEIVEAISPNFDLSRRLSVLQVQLTEVLKRQKFVLVLDDIWQITQHQWESFHKPLRNGLEGSMILVTTRHENIARLVTTSNCNPVQLKELPDDIFWEFFKKCAFDKECPDSYPHLQEIGRSISSKLCGTPLAAKTLGRLLNSNLTEQHWMTIKDSELWDQEQKEGDILPALRLSYLYLPTELRRCFAFCSMFPKDYSFRRQEIVGIWVAEGFVAPLKSMCIEEVGIRCLDKLRDRCLFQADPKFPNQDRYVMHDLIHDTAQYVSKHECFLMKDLSNSGRHEFRHMSVEVDFNSLSTMENIQNLNKLRSLRFGTKLDAEITWFSHLSNILFLSLNYCMLKKLPESICELSSLRYLDISSSNVEELPAKFWCFYSLQVVDASNSRRLAKIPPITTKLTNLRRLELAGEGPMALSTVHGLGNLCCLQNLSYFTVEERKGAIGELNGMNELRGALCIRSIRTVKSREEAAEARLFDKTYLKELELDWRIKISEISEPRPGENDVMDGLCPNERIQSLKVENFWGDRLPSWFNPKYLQNLRSLELCICPYIETLSSSNFTVGAQGCSQHASSSTNCSNDITFNQPVIHRAYIMGFVHLQDMRLDYCSSLVCPQQREMVLPPSLRRLHIVSCGQLDMSFPSCLENLTRLTVLALVGCHNVESIPLDSIPCRNKLKYVRFGYCGKLSCIGGSGIPSSIGHVDIYNCGKLTQVQQPFLLNALPIEEAEEIGKFLRSPVPSFARAHS